MTHIKYLLNCKKFISLMILFSFFDNFGMDAYSTNSKDFNKNLFSSDKEGNAINVGFVGASGVGKTNIISRFLNKSFSEKYIATSAVDCCSKTVKINGKDISLLFWDAPENLVFIESVQHIFGSFDLLVFVYAVDDRNSFEKVKNFFLFYPELNPKIESWLVGNKIVSDSSRVVLKTEGEDFAKINNIEYFEFSAKTGAGFNEDFFNPFISKLLTEKKLNKEPRGLDNDNNSICLNSSFCDECCSCYPCMKHSED